MMIYCYNDPFSWGRELHAEIEKRKGAAQMMTHALQVPDDKGTYTFTCMSRKEREYVKALNEELGQKKNIVQIPSLKEGRLYDELVEQYKEFGSWMPSTFLFRSLEQATANINEVPYPIVSTSNTDHKLNRRLLEQPDDALAEAIQVFSENGKPLPGGNVQKDYLFWQPNVNRQKVTWHIFMATKRYAVITEVPSGTNPYDPNTPISTVEVLSHPMTELLKYVYVFCLDHDFKWVSVEVVAGTDVVQQVASPFVLGMSVSWPSWWFERGGMIFETENGTDWKSTGVPAVALWGLMADAILKGEFDG